MHKLPWLLASVMTVVSSGTATAEEKSQAYRFQQLFKEYQSEEAKLKDEMLKTKSPDYVSANFVSEAPLERLSDFGRQFLDIAQEDLRTDAAWQALRYVAYVRGFAVPDKDRAMRLIAKHHNAREEFVDDLYFHHYRPGIDANAFYRIILEEEGLERRVVGLTKYCLAVGISGTIHNKEWLSTEEISEIKHLLKSVLAEYSDLPHPVAKDKRTLGEAAAALEYQVTRLMVGQEAPDIEGCDVDGKPIRLSDYRGNVVLLVFCGEWCGPCRAMYPHERAMIEDFGSRPFSILGVNSDPKDVLRKAIVREQFPWRWIWDRGSPDGPIATKWGVNQWPAFVLIDQVGIIRKRRFARRSIEELTESIRSEISNLIPESK